MKTPMLVTDDRTLEQFLYAHRHRFRAQRKENGRTHWVYPVDSRLLETIREYLDLYKEASA